MDASSPIRREIIFGEKNATEKEIHIFNQIKGLMSKYYPDHDFASHKILMEFKIKGAVPYLEDIDYPTSEYPIFNFLFGPMTYYGNPDIIR